jgi:hypothetical protein
VNGVQQQEIWYSFASFCFPSGFLTKSWARWCYYACYLFPVSIMVRNSPQPHCYKKKSAIPLKKARLQQIFTPVFGVLDAAIGVHDTNLLLFVDNFVTHL